MKFLRAFKMVRWIRPALLALVFALVGSPSSEAAPALQSASGVFLGIEQGDYAHWKMRLTNGKEVDYFILRPDATIEAVLANPEARVGQKCRIQWKTTTENLPEAGGKQAVDQAVSVEWLK